MRESNEEVRRVMIERVGEERFAEMMKWETVSEDDFGTLLQTEINGEKYMIAHVIDPSTGREYYLAVPSSIEEAIASLRPVVGWEEWTEENERAIWPESGKMETCKQACGWTFGFKAEEYEPLFQT